MLFGSGAVLFNVGFLLTPVIIGESVTYLKDLRLDVFRCKKTRILWLVDMAENLQLVRVAIQVNITGIERGLYIRQTLTIQAPVWQTLKLRHVKVGFLQIPCLGTLPNLTQQSPRQGSPVEPDWSPEMLLVNFFVVCSRGCNRPHQPYMWRDLFC